MAGPSKIEWTDATLNQIGGCSIKSPGCIHCYAQRLSVRHPDHPIYKGVTSPSKNGPVFNGHLTIAPDDHDLWTWPIRWRGAKQPVMGTGKPSLIFVGDMSDLFHEDRPDEHIDRVIASLIYSRHIAQLLTKRTDRMLEYFTGLCESGRWLSFKHPLLGKTNFDPFVASFDNCFLPRFWLGGSVERQQEADERRPALQKLSALGFTTFVSYEPALGAIDWTGWEFLTWFISGGESGPRARPSHPDWHRAARIFATDRHIRYLFKQWGAFAPHRAEGIYENVERVDFTDGVCMLRVGKKAAGRLLDGRTWDQFPEVRA